VHPRRRPSPGEEALLRPATAPPSSPVPAGGSLRRPRRVAGRPGGRQPATSGTCRRVACCGGARRSCPGWPPVGRYAKMSWLTAGSDVGIAEWKHRWRGRESMRHLRRVRETTRHRLEDRRRGIGVRREEKTSRREESQCLWAALHVSEWAGPSEWSGTVRPN
jgi:hypothetical protein